jgi:hypothetical protein
MSTHTPNHHIHLLARHTPPAMSTSHAHQSIRDNHSHPPHPLMQSQPCSHSDRRIHAPHLPTHIHTLTCHIRPPSLHIHSYTHMLASIYPLTLPHRPIHASAVTRPSARYIHTHSRATPVSPTTICTHPLGHIHQLSLANPPRHQFSKMCLSRNTLYKKRIPNKKKII